MESGKRKRHGQSAISASPLAKNSALSHRPPFFAGSVKTHQYGWGAPIASIAHGVSLPSWALLFSSSCFMCYPLGSYADLISSVARL